MDGLIWDERREGEAVLGDELDRACTNGLLLLSGGGSVRFRLCGCCGNEDVGWFWCGGGEGVLASGEEMEVGVACSVGLSSGGKEDGACSIGDEYVGAVNG